MKAIQSFMSATLILAATCLAGCERNGASPTSTQARIEAAVKERLKDPDSARFKEAKVLDQKWACIAVNAKNSFGGYSGFSEFFLYEGAGQWGVVHEVKPDSLMNCVEMYQAAKEEEKRRNEAEVSKKAIDTGPDRRGDITREELLAIGEKGYKANCAACHGAAGLGAGPIKKLDGSPMFASGQGDAALRVVIFGASNGMMPSWKDNLSNTEIAAIVTYVGNSWSNKAGQLVQPSQVSKIRNGT